ncbi:MAG: anti-sigma factor [Pseudomonadota bacterium]
MNLQGTTLDSVAGAYVLGSLSPRARRRFNRLLQTDAAARASCDRWEERLAGLYLALPSVRPEAGTWPAILARLDARARSGTGQRPARLKQLLAAMIVGASLALGWFYYQQNMAPVYTALVADQAGAGMWDFSAPANASKLTVHTHRPGLVPANQAYELWALPGGGGTPVSLGLISPSGDINVLALQEGQRRALQMANQIAISVEPPGGSPTGAPTGPVIHVAPLQRRG